MRDRHKKSGPKFAFLHDQKLPSGRTMAITAIKFWLKRLVVVATGVGVFLFHPAMNSTAGSAPFFAKQPRTPADMCDAAARQASVETGVPYDVLRAVSRVETGRRTEFGLQPWPWAVNDGGKGFWFKTRNEAVTHLRRNLALGHTNFDVGCFQVNFRWHGHAFDSVDDMITPLGNARFAATFLSNLFQEFADWRQAVAAYHSRTPDLGGRYAERFDSVYQHLKPTDPGSFKTTEHVATRGGASWEKPFLQALPLVSGGSFAPGSLMPGSGDGLTTPITRSTE
jgi:Transglycosylase SLT domain